MSIGSQYTNFRTNPVASPPLGVDRQKNVIFGAVLMERGPLAEGDTRPWEVDETTLRQVADFTNQPNRGLKARFTHPNMSNDGLGSHLGRWKNARVDGDVVRGDLHLSDTSFDTPNGNLGSYVLDLAEEDPDAFGVSVAGTALDEEMFDVPDGYDGPLNIRFKGLRAADFVDTPAAVSGGLFSAEMTSRDPAYMATWILDHLFNGKTGKRLNLVSARSLISILETQARNMKCSEPTVTVTTTSAEMPALNELEVPSVSLEAVPAQIEQTADPRLEAAEILALCALQGCPEKATEFFEKEFTVDQVKDALLAAAAAKNTALEVGGDDSIEPEDGLTQVERKFAAEYDANPNFAGVGIDKEGYILSRKREEGLVPLNATLGM